MEMFHFYTQFYFVLCFLLTPHTWEVLYKYFQFKGRAIHSISFEENNTYLQLCQHRENSFLKTAAIGRQSMHTPFVATFCCRPIELIISFSAHNLI